MQNINANPTSLHPAGHEDLVEKYTTKQYDRCLRETLQRIKQKPDDVLYWIKACCEKSQKNPKEALISIQKALEIKEETIYFHVKGGIHRILGEYPEAIENFKKAYEKVPLIWFLNNIGDTYILMENYEEALKAYDESSQRNSKDYYGFLQKGLCLMQLKNYQEALNSFRAALEVNDANIKGKRVYDYEVTNRILLTNEGLMLAKLGQKDGAFQCFDEVIKRYPKSPSGELCEKFKAKLAEDQDLEEVYKHCPVCKDKLKLVSFEPTKGEGGCDECVQKGLVS